jgi:hypothetical protein
VVVVCFGVSQLSEKYCAKGVDGLSLALHNLVSLLLMQRRRTKRCRVVVMLTTRGAGPVVNA